MSAFSSFAIGQYIPTDSLLHRLDARAKLISLLIVAAATLIASDMASFGLLIGTILFLQQFSRLPLSVFWIGLRPVWWILAIIFCFQLAFHPGQYSLWQWGPVHVTQEGVVAGTLLTLRIGILVIFASLLTWTTRPLELTAALERLASPLKRFGVPVQELALVISISLRFIPTVGEEFVKIVRAQQSRGATLRRGPLRDRFRHVLALFIPLLVATFRRAEMLATAMDARGYRISSSSKRRLPQWNRADTISVMGSIILFIVIVACWKGFFV